MAVLIPAAAGIATVISSAVASVFGRFAGTAVTVGLFSTAAKVLITWALFTLGPLALVVVMVNTMQLLLPFIFDFVLGHMQGVMPEMVLQWTGPAAYMAVKFQIPNILALLSAAVTLRFFLRIFRII